MDWFENWFQILVIALLVLLAIGRAVIQAVLKPGPPARPGEQKRPPPIREILEEIRREAGGEAPPEARAQDVGEERALVDEPVEVPPAREAPPRRAFEPPRQAEEPPLLRPAPRRAVPQGGAARPPRAPAGRGAAQPWRPGQVRPAPRRGGVRPRAPVPAATVKPPEEAEQRGSLRDRLEKRDQLAGIRPEADLNLEEQQRRLDEGSSRKLVSTDVGARQSMPLEAARLVGMGLDLRKAILAQMILGPPRALESLRRGAPPLLRGRPAAPGRGEES